MPKQSKPPTFLFEFRADPTAVSLWLVAKEGPACSGLAHGIVGADVAKHLADAMTAAGFECRWRVPIGPSADQAASDEVKMERQQTLFAESTP